ncbi:MAG: adenylate/guanylate cyclase domain-containing protein [Pseudomonadota bacterium]
MLFSNWLGRFPIAIKVSAVLVLLGGAVLGVFWFLVMSALQSILQDVTDHFGKTLAAQIAYAAAEPLLAEDELSLKVIVNNATQAPNVQAVLIFDRENQILAGSEPSKLQNAEIFLPDDPTQLLAASNRLGMYVSPIMFKDVIAGQLIIYVDQQRIQRKVQDTVQVMTLVLFCLLFLTAFVALYLGRHLTQPVVRLNEAVLAIGAGRYDHRIQEERRDEIGMLIENVNLMAEGLEEKEKIKETFSRYMAPNVADNILANLDNPSVPIKYVDASVMFVDLVGFTGICESFPPNEVAQLLNEYYGCILLASEGYKGTVDKFIGDGAMILFGAPQSESQHALNAISCAGVFLHLVKEINELRKNRGQAVMQFRIGIHSGEMLAGSLGSDKRMQYTVIGDVVNIASRLCHQAEPGCILVSEESCESAQKIHEPDGTKVELNFQPLIVKDLGETEVRGRAAPVQAKQILGFHEIVQKSLDEHLASVIDLIHGNHGNVDKEYV